MFQNGFRDARQFAVAAPVGLFNLPAVKIADSNARRHPWRREIDFSISGEPRGSDINPGYGDSAELYPARDTQHRQSTRRRRESSS